MQRTLRVSGALVVLAAAAACTTTSPSMNPRITAAEAALSRANSDPEMHNLGRASLEDASTQLVAAREAYRHHNDDDFVHAIRMAETNIQLAEARGNQGKAAQAIERIQTQQGQLQLTSRDRDVAEAQAGQVRAEQATARATAGQVRAERETTVAVASRQRAEAATRQMRAELSDYQMQETNLGMMLMLQDLQFATESAVLRESAKVRLDPLASYLSRNRGTNIRIAGFTDSLGEEDYNLVLSQLRATAVAAYLEAHGVNASRIQTVGMGETAPIGSNATTSGREENRRVEVTLLKS